MRRGFIKIVDWAALQGEAALEHRPGVKPETQQQQRIVDPIVPSESLAQEENRVNGAEAVENHGDQKILPVSQPAHELKLDERVRGARLNWLGRQRGRAASSSWISPSAPSGGGEGWGEELRFYWLPLSSVLSPLVPRGERMERLMQPRQRGGLAITGIRGAARQFTQARAWRSGLRQSASGYRFSASLLRISASTSARVFVV